MLILPVSAAYCSLVSSSINGVIRPVLDFLLLFFFTIRFHKYKKAPKSTKKHRKAPKGTKKHNQFMIYGHKIQPVLNLLFSFTIRFHYYKKAPKSTKKHQKALKSTTNLKFIDTRFIDLKFIDTRFIEST